jgi:phosphatidylserine synthase
MSFIGLPTPGAAGVIVSLVILHQETLPSLNIIIYALPFSALGTAALMVSRIRYPHILNQYLRGKKPFAYLIRGLLLLVLVIYIQVSLAPIFCGFAASSFVKWVYYKVIRNKHNIVSAAQSALIMSNKDQIIDGENIGYKAEE